LCKREMIWALVTCGGMEVVTMVEVEELRTVVVSWYVRGSSGELTRHLERYLLLQLYADRV